MSEVWCFTPHDFINLQAFDCYYPVYFSPSHMFYYTKAINFICYYHSHVWCTSFSSIWFNTIIKKAPKRIRTSENDDCKCVWTFWKMLRELLCLALLMVSAVSCVTIFWFTIYFKDVYGFILWFFTVSSSSSHTPYSVRRSFITAPTIIPFYECQSSSLQELDRTPLSNISNGNQKCWSSAAIEFERQ